MTVHPGVKDDNHRQNSLKSSTCDNWLFSIRTPYAVVGYLSAFIPPTTPTTLCTVKPIDGAFLTYDEILGGWDLEVFDNAYS